MSDKYTSDSMLDMYIFETAQFIEQLEQLILSSEKSNMYSSSDINEIFRIMHTIKGSSAMMLYNNIATLAHAVEDLFYFIREENPQNIDFPTLSDLVLESIDFIKVELEKIKNNDEVDGDGSTLIDNIRDLLFSLKQINALGNTGEIKEITENEKIQQKEVAFSSENYAFKAVITFEEDCDMEGLRAFMVIDNLKEHTDDYYHIPEVLMDNDEADEIIRHNGFEIFFNIGKSYEEVYKYFIDTTVLLKNLELIKLDNVGESSSDSKFDIQIKHEQLKNKDDLVKMQQVDNKKVSNKRKKESKQKDLQMSQTQSIISVNIAKLDKLMDLVGEMVIAEAMVTQNPDLKGLEIENFKKAARQLHKITGELQDTVMSIRMVPLATTFHKMNRIVRDMSKKLSKHVELEIIGEDTEVDKNIIEHISDPLMHLIRNSIDHGIENSNERAEKGKTEPARITLEGRNAGGDVLILVKDNGRGLNKTKILEKAKENELLNKPESEMTDKEIYSLIFLPGFSTKESVSEFSGRGVGMDVVLKNIESIRGAISIDSIPDEGTTITLKIPLTLAIIDGMNVRVGRSQYTIPTVTIKQSFRARGNDVIIDSDGNEMIMVRGQCYPVLRLHKLYNVKTNITNIEHGIMMMTESEGRILCIFADELVGEHQVVVKALPDYIKNTKKIKGLMGCTLLGDGSISLILDIQGLVN